MIRYRHTTRPRFSDTDAHGVIHHGAYVAFAEEAKLALLTSPDYFGIQMLEFNDRLVVTKLVMKFIRSGVFHAGEEFTVDLELTAIENVKLVFSHTISDAVGVLCTGRSEHVAVDHRGRITELPASLTSAYRALEGRHPC